MFAVIPAAAAAQPVKGYFGIWVMVYCHGLLRHAEATWPKADCKRKKAYYFFEGERPVLKDIRTGSAA